MTPLPRSACEIQADVLKVRSKIRKKIKNGRVTIEKIIENIAKVLWGMPDFVIADLMSTVSNIAANVAQTVLGKVSAGLAGILQSILQELLSIFLQSADGMYALTAIPHEKAIASLALEQNYLSNVRAKLSLIAAIIRKWITKTSGVDYYGTMKLALPVIQEAFSLLTEVITGLDNNVNSTFDVNAYTRALSKIEEAIEITGPETATDKMFNPMGAIEDQKEVLLADRLETITDTYNKLREEASTEYQEALAGVAGRDGVVGGAISEAEEYTERMKYRTKLAGINNDEKIKIARAEAGAYQDAGMDYLKNGIGSAARTLSDEFNADMVLMQEALRTLPEELGQAYLHNKASQSLCNVLYNFKSTVLKLIEMLITLIRHTGNGAGVGTGSVIKTAQAAVGVAEDFVVDGIAEYEEPGSDKTSTSAAAQLIGARSALIGADIMLGTTIVEALIQLINLDDKLSTTNQEYKEFTALLADIPDWDGNKNIWAVNPLNGVKSPYIGLIGDVAGMLATASVSIVPGVVGSKKLEKLDKSLGRVFDSIEEISEHNFHVARVVKTWDPPYSYHADELKKALSKAGPALDLFAFGLSLTSVLASFGVNLPEFGIGYIKCADAYPELYVDPDISAMLEEDARNYPTVAESNPKGLQNALVDLAGKTATLRADSRDLVVASRKDINLPMSS